MTNRGGGREFGPIPGAPPATTRSGRRLAQLDNGTVALAITGMAFYWLMPAMLRRGTPRPLPPRAPRPPRA